MIADIDRARLADDVLSWLAAKNLSYRDAAGCFAGLNPAMINRAKTCQVLSAASLLALTRAMGVDPMGYLVLVDPLQARLARQQNQAVTAIASRETGLAQDGGGGP